MPKNLRWHFYSVQTSSSTIKVPHHSCLENLTPNERVIVRVINTSHEALLWDELVSSDIPNGSHLHRNIMGQSFAPKCRIVPLSFPLLGLYFLFSHEDIKALKQALYLTFILEMFPFLKKQHDPN